MKGEYREFKLIVEDWRTNALPWKDDLQNLTTGEEIHTIEYSALTDLLKELEGVEDALAFYGNKKNWRISCSDEISCHHDMIVEDCGDEVSNGARHWYSGNRARQALAKLQEIKERFNGK